jgi:hypothetical protein
MGGRNVPGGQDYLSRNLSLLAQLNLDIYFQVKVAHSIYHGQLSEFDRYPNLEIVVQEYSEDNFVGLEELDPVVQHGALLNRLIQKYPPTSKYVLILDPDCYAIERDFIRKCIKEMAELEISVIGVPYPAWYPKEYSWKTPQLYFSIFDTDKISLQELDLRAGGGAISEQVSTHQRSEGFALKITRRFRSLLSLVTVFEFTKPLDLVLYIKEVLLNRRFKINPEDTGWRIGNLLESENIEYMVFPNILKENYRVPGFNQKEYLNKNRDLNDIESHLGWHFLSQGLLEARYIGNQGYLPRLLRRFVGSDANDTSKWPSSSILGRDKVSNSKDLELVLQKIPAADYYAFNGKFTLFHIGSKGKGQIHNEIGILDSIVAEFSGRVA